MNDEPRLINPIIRYGVGYLGHGVLWVMTKLSNVMHHIENLRSTNLISNYDEV